MVSTDAGALNPVGSDPACGAASPEEIAETAAWLESLLTPMPGKGYEIGVGTRAEQGPDATGIGANDLVDDFLRQARAAASALDSTAPGERARPDEAQDSG